VLFLFDFDFLPISILLVYVGAIAVLFIFVLMMLNIKLSELKGINVFFWPASIFCFFFLFFEIISIFRFKFDVLELTQDYMIFHFFDLLNFCSLNFLFFDSFFFSSNVKTLALAFFSSYLFGFILVAFTLLLAMISTILLSLDKRFIIHKQNVYLQNFEEA
jgi:NADH-ubiquinone oxidoreductase chain 6